MTGPRFLPGQSVSDERHKNSDDGNERCGDVQPSGSRNSLTTDDVWSDVTNREQNRQIQGLGVTIIEGRDYAAAAEPAQVLPLKT